jgi:uncharacterized protein YdhG (YjbR/CyaY superfamily)
MQYKATTPEDYVSQLPEERQVVISKLRGVIKANLPAGFEEVISYGMIGYVVPHSIYPDGYHCDTKLPLPFLSLASHKNFVAGYHMGVYADPVLLEWFVGEYPKYVKTKLDMGKGYVRLKKMDKIPYKLIGELASKMTVQDWVSLYESKVKG